MPAADVDHQLPGLDEARFDDAREGDPRLAAAGRGGHDRLFGERFDRIDALARLGSIARIAFDADEGAAKSARDRAGGAGAEKGIEHEIARVRRGKQNPRQERLRLLRRMDLSPLAVLQPLRAGADRQEPVRTRLAIVIAGLHHLVVERVALGVGAAGGPDHRLVGVGEAAAAEIRHRIGLAPHDVVEDPEAEVLENRPDAKDVVIGADDNEGGVRLHQPPRCAEPAPREGVVFGEVGELVPSIVDRVDEALIRPGESALELQVVRRIGEDKVHRRRRKPVHLRDAVADQDRVASNGNDCGRAFRLAVASTQNLKLGGETQRAGAQDTHGRKSLDSTARSLDPARRLWPAVSKSLVMPPQLTLCRFESTKAKQRIP